MAEAHHGCSSVRDHEFPGDKTSWLTWLDDIELLLAGNIEIRNLNECIWSRQGSPGCQVPVIGQDLRQLSYRQGDKVAYEACNDMLLHVWNGVNIFARVPNNVAHVTELLFIHPAIKGCRSTNGSGSWCCQMKAKMKS
jgi:hypothetical protein